MTPRAGVYFLDNILMASPACLLGDFVISRGDLNGFVKSLGRKGKRVIESIYALGCVFAHEIVRRMTIVADRHGVVARTWPSRQNDPSSRGNSRKRRDHLLNRMRRERRKNVYPPIPEARPGGQSKDQTGKQPGIRYGRRRLHQKRLYRGNGAEGRSRNYLRVTGQKPEGKWNPIHPPSRLLLANHGENRPRPHRLPTTPFLCSRLERFLDRCQGVRQKMSELYWVFLG